MDIEEHELNQRPWRILGKSGEVKISVAPPTSIRVEVGGHTAILPIQIVMALQTDEAREFVTNPAVGSFLYGTSERESRIRAARKIAELGLAKKRRDFVDSLMAHGVSVGEAWELAKLKYPIQF